MSTVTENTISIPPPHRERSRSFSTDSSSAHQVPTQGVSPIPLRSPSLGPASPTSSSLSASLKAFADLSMSPPTTLNSEEFQKAFHHARRSSFNGNSNTKPFIMSLTTEDSNNAMSLPPMSSSPSSSAISDTLPTPPSSSPPKITAKGNVVARPIKTLDGVCEKEELTFVEDENDMPPPSSSLFANGARWGWPQQASNSASTTNPATSPLLSSSPPSAAIAPPATASSLVRRSSLSAGPTSPPTMAPLSRVVSGGSAGTGTTAGTASTGSSGKASDGFGLFRRLSVGGFGGKPKAPSPPSSSFGGSNAQVAAPPAIVQPPAPSVTTSTTAATTVPVTADDSGSRGRKSLNATTAGTKTKRRVSPFGERMLRDLGH